MTEVKSTFPVGVSVLLTNKFGNILLATRKNNSGAGLLSTPGGRLEQNETILECAAREFREECLAELGPVEIIGWREHFRFGKHYIMFYAHATTYTGEIQNGIPDKSDDWTFLPLQSILPGTCTEPDDILSLVTKKALAL